MLLVFEDILGPIGPLPYLSFLMKDIITKKDSSISLMSVTSQTTITELIKSLYKKDISSSTMSFTNLIMKTELVKCLQHFALIVKFYTNVLSTQNIVTFKRNILPYLSFPMKNIYTKRQFKFDDVI